MYAIRPFTASGSRAMLEPPMSASPAVGGARRSILSVVVCRAVGPDEAE